MKVIYGSNKIRRFKKPVLALGVFDGVHRGHIEILKEAVRKARSIKGTSIVLTFWPHPQKEQSLYSLEHRLRLISNIGIDACVVINFNHKFAAMPAPDFVKDILFNKLAPRYVYAGKNFRFGKNAKGDSRTLSRLSKIYNFRVKIFEVIKIQGKPISSTYIRALIKKGKLALAKKLLTRPVSILGTVIKGDSLARKLGFPTANINPHHEVIPPHGVYAVRAIVNGGKFNGACYIGSRPTFPDKKSKNVEVHIFNFGKHIYEKVLEIQFIKRIRGEKKFNSVPALVEQIRKDLLAARNISSLH
ncbi:MAG: bifunctional riboflavin kinase/FAD synthetase [Candidatus Omnitrophota bacterium]